MTATTAQKPMKKKDEQNECKKKKRNWAGKMYNNNKTDVYEYNTKSSRKPAKREK